MSDSEDEASSNLPSADECQKRCQNFAEVTGTDTALAMYYLQDRNWDIERALNAYFAGGGEASSGSSKIPVEFASDSEDDSASSKDESNKQTNDRIPQTSASSEDPEPYRIRLMTWNIDGLDPRNLRSRTLGVCETINKELPHIVFLQELVPPSQAIIEEQCPAYSIIPGAEKGYYVAVMLHVMAVQLEDTAILPFPSSVMARNIITVKCKIKDEKFYLMTSHLESTKNYSKERKSQLQKALGHLVKTDANRTAIFGGDLNLRDNELSEIGGLPDGVYDMWEITGKRPVAKFTWDVTRNDNLDWGDRFKPKCRFDRLYVRYAEKTPVKAVYFELVGLERLSSCQRFCSDHWGLLSHFNIVSKLPK